MKTEQQLARVVQYSMISVLFIIVFLILFFSMEAALGFYFIFVIINMCINIIFKSKLNNFHIVTSSLMGPVLTVMHIFFYVKMKEIIGK